MADFNLVQLRRCRPTKRCLVLPLHQMALVVFLHQVSDDLYPVAVLGLFRGTLCQHLHFRYRLRIWVDDRFLYIPRNRYRTT